MVMIPNGVGVQLRSQTDAPLNPLRPVAEIPADLPDLDPGQVFRARIQEVLPENTYRALVAGRLMTLSLPDSAKAGDTLELVVLERTPRAIVAQLTQPAGVGQMATAGHFQHNTLSPAGQLLASLLPREGEAAPPAALTRGQPLLSLAQMRAADVALHLPAQLAQAINSSGMFYEAHQLQWALGQRPLASLLDEPQMAGRDYGETELPAEKSALVIRREAVTSGVSPRAMLQKLFGGESARASAAAAESSVPANQPPAAWRVPDELRPLVQQQIEAAATQRVTWHGEIWPDQPMQWEIERDAPQTDVAHEEQASWRTALHLTLPRLGKVEAGVQLSGQNVRLVLHMSASAAPDLQQAIPGLQQALATAGLSLQSVQAIPAGASG